MKPEEQIILSMIVAHAKNGVIGYQGKMPWHIPSELAHFKRTTLDKPVLMGRKTWESLFVQPLPGRDNLVLSRDENYRAAGAECFFDFDTMLQCGEKLAREKQAKEMVVIGGAMLYALALPFASRIYLTSVDADLEGDAWFMPLPDTQWQRVGTLDHTPSDKDEYGYSISVFERV